MHNIIYKITNSINNKSYIGLTTGTLEKRWSDHLSEAKFSTSNRHFYNAIKKYSLDVWDISILFCSLESKFLNDIEIILINEYNTYHSGYNSTTGGEGCPGHKHSIETKHKMSLAHQGEKNSMFGVIMSDESKEKMSIAKKGKKRGPMSQEQKDKLSKIKKGKKLGPMKEITKQKMSKARKGRIVSTETRRKISEAKKGKGIGVKRGPYNKEPH